MNGRACECPRLLVACSLVARLAEGGSLSCSPSFQERGLGVGSSEHPHGTGAEEAPRFAEFASTSPKRERGSSFTCIDEPEASEDLLSRPLILTRNSTQMGR